MKILEKCNELGATSLAIPMIGAGQHGFPEEVVLQVIKNEVSNLSSSKGGRFTVKEILVVVFQNKPERRQTVPFPKKRGISKPPTSEIKEKDGETSSPEIAFGPVRLRLLSGEVAEFKADACINFWSTIARMTTAISQFMNIDSENQQKLADDAAGEPIKPPPRTVLITEASPNATTMYNMHCVPVSFGVSGLKNATGACLNAAQFFPLNSVIISASEMMSLSVSANECAEAILNAAKTFSTENFTIHIAVVFDSDTTQNFKKVFEKKVTEQKTSARSEQVAASPHEVTTKHQSGMNKTLNIGAKEEVVFRVVGFRENVNASIEKIEAYINRSKVTKSVKDAKIVKGFWNHVSQIKKLSNGYNVVITLTADEVRIEGIGQHVFECKDALMDFLMKNEENENELKRLREISKSVQWSYIDVNCTVFFDDRLTGEIESAFINGEKSFTLEGLDNTYDLHLGKMVIQERTTCRTALLARKQTSTGKFYQLILLIIYLAIQMEKVSCF